MSSQTLSTPSRVHTNNLNPLGADGVVRCYCDNPAPLLTSHTEKNPGREFYKCLLGKDDPGTCKFFKWKDEIMPPGPSQSPSQSQSRSQPHIYPHSQPATPSNRQRQAQRTDPWSRSQTLTTPGSTSKKRPRSRTPPMSDDAHNRRMANIRAALGGPSTSAEPPIPALDTTSAMAPAKRTRFATTVQATPEDDDRFFSAFSSPPSVPEADGALPRVMTPAQRRLAQSNALASGSNDEDDEYARFFSPPPAPDPPTPTPQRKMKMKTEYSAGMATPPMSTSPGPYSARATPSASKGKARESEGASQWQKIEADPANPFHAPSSSLRDTQPTSSVPTTPGGGAGLPEEIQALVDGANALPAFIAKLQRRHLAAERSAEAKGRKIEELQGENDRLKNKVRVLEETIAAVRARRPPE